MYFFVSDWFLDHEKNKYSFSEGFIKSLVPNAPADIEDTMKKNLVSVIENTRKNFVKSIKPAFEKSELKFESTLENGAKVMVSDEWLKENFCTLYTIYYNTLHDEANLDTELDLPEGYIDTLSNCEMDDSAGLEMNHFGFLGMGCPVEVMCKGEAT